MLQDLPSEIINQIAEHVEPQSLLQVRLTSRRLRDQSFPAFAAAFFSSITIDLCPHSIERLRQIANDEQLRRHVRSVSFGAPFNKNPYPGVPSPGWLWHETARCVDLSQEPIAELCASSFSRLDNCRTVYIMREIVPGFDPHGAAVTAPLCEGVAADIALLAASRLPSLRALHQRHPMETSCYRAISGGRQYHPVPATVHDQLGESWGRSLVDLDIEACESRNNELPSTLDLILRATSLRKLSLRCQTPVPFRRLALATAVPPLQILKLHLTESITAEDLIALTARFSSTLQHIHLHRVHTAPADERPRTLRRVCLAWVTQLPHLRSFGLQYLPSGTPKKALTFNRVLDWEEPPGEGQLLFLGKRGGRGRGHIWGVSYAGPTEDARRVLVRIAEGAVAEDEETGGERRVVDATDWARKGFSEEYMVGGRLMARCVGSLDTPEVVTS